MKPNVYLPLFVLEGKNITVIYISHILDDIFTIGDVVTVFRDGEIVGTKM